MVIDIPISSGTILTILLPMLLFQGAITIDVRRLAKDFVAVLLLAVLAVLVALVIIGGAVYLVAPMPLVVCLLFGAIVATTDPSAVIAMFRDLGAPARLTRLVEGEKLGRASCWERGGQYVSISVVAVALKKKTI